MNAFVGPPGLFICGTGTGVGKTYVACLLARTLRQSGQRVGVYKPVESGATSVESSDAFRLWEAAGRPKDLADVCPQSFAAPLAPHLAARAEGRTVDPARLRDGVKAWRDYDLILVEGAGGLFSPVSDDDYVADLAYDLGYPMLVVTGNELGTINATLQTLIAAAAFEDGIPVAGIIVNDYLAGDHDADPSRQSNAGELEQRCGPPVLAHLPHGGTALDGGVDWVRLAGPPRELPSPVDD